MRQRQKVILDVDTGVDDAVALLMAAGAPSLSLVGVTVVMGNGPLDLTLANTLKTLDAAHLSDVPVYAGADLPLLAPLSASLPIQALAFDLPEPTMQPQDIHAVDFLVDYYLGSEGPKTTLVPLAPLTNVALALRREPRLAARIPRLVMMGGAVGHGNATPSAEFNVWTDPEAAQIVFRSGIPIVMVGLEATNTARITLHEVAQARALPSPGAQVAADLLAVDVLWFKEHLNEDAEVFDACAVAAAMDAKVLRTEAMHVDVETRGELTRGRTVCTTRPPEGQSCHVQVGLATDRPRFLRLLLDALAHLPLAT